MLFFVTNILHNTYKSDLMIYIQKIFPEIKLFLGIICDRDRIRTYDRLLRRQMLYPAELRDLIKNPCKSITYKGLSGETGIRTQATLSR